MLAAAAVGGEEEEEDEEAEEYDDEEEGDAERSTTASSGEAGREAGSRVFITPFRLNLRLDPRGNTRFSLVVNGSKTEDLRLKCGGGE